MDPVFVEESKNLEQIEYALDRIISSYAARRNELQRSLSGYVCYDYDDRLRFLDLQSSMNREEKCIAEYEGYKPSPYFARMDLDTDVDGTDEIETMTVFVGKNGIRADGETLVIDWRSELGQYYYMKSELNFKINDYAYQLVLRRALDIANGKLISYNTEYDGSNVTLEGDIIDEFLLTVLKDKRRHNRLTDIIRSIQANQNEIIRKPVDESFVVQGCAGSGKTMILLHRLSYILFNNKNLLPSSIKIITPNKFFDAHINELSRELGLDQIQRFTVEEYYVELIHQYSGKIDVNAVVTSEKGLDEKLLRSIYSPEFADRFASYYHKYWEEIARSLSQLRLPEIFGRCGKKYPDFTVHKTNTYAAAENAIREIISSYQHIRSENRKTLERIEAIQDQLDVAKARFDQAEAQIKSARDQALNAFQAERQECDKLLSDLQQQAADLKVRIKGVIDELEQKEGEREKLTRLHTRIAQNTSAYLDINGMENTNDDIAKQLVESTAEIREQRQRAKAELDAAAFYNFGRRNTLRRQISELETRYSETVEQTLASIRADIERILTEVNDEIAALENTQSELNAQEQQIKQSRQDISKRNNAAKSCMEAFESREYPNLEVLLPKADYTLILPLAYQYATTYSSYREARRVLDRLEESLKSCNEILAHNGDMLTEDEVAALKKCKALVAQLRFSDISRHVLFKNLFAEYRAFKQPYHKDNYRHKLYLRLLLCYLYFTDRHSTRFIINIDEAQDIAVTEYNLMRQVLSAQSVFNLYGDVNQLVYSYKGISNWGDIDFITGGHEYTLNENYRNTKQITEYCNKEFDADVYPIGISGEPVEVYSLADAVQAILKIKLSNPTARTAIVYRYGRSKILESIGSVLSPGQASLDIVDDDKISVISVEAAKGLEFDAVAVITDSLNYNEKYIAFTRALDRLFVVNESFPAEEVQTDVQDEIEEFFIEESEPEPDVEEVVEPEIADEVAPPDAPAAAEDDVGSEDEQAEIAKEPSEQLWAENASDSTLFSEVCSHISAAFAESYSLDEQQKLLIHYLAARENVACTAPSGWSKSILFYVMAAMNHRAGRGQTLLTAEGHLQENELVLADRLGVKAGILVDSVESFDQDFKKDKYDIIFVPYDYFLNQNRIDSLVHYFAGKVAYWSVNHPKGHPELWEILRASAEQLSVPMYLMSKEGFADIDISSFKLIEIDSGDIRQTKKLIFADETQKNKWLIENSELFYGQGLIYCNEPSTCAKVAKMLRKVRVNTQAYTEDNNDSEFINYVTNSFSNGGLPVLATTHHFGKNLANPRMRFIIHYDIPKDIDLYRLHLGQIGSLGENPVIYDLSTYE